LIGILGSGGFGTALAVALARDGKPVTLCARNADHVEEMVRVREHRRRLPGVRLPELVSPTSDVRDLQAAEPVLIASPSQPLADVLAEFADILSGKTLVACCKGIDPASGLGPASRTERAFPRATPAQLSGPGFATDIAAGLPTAMTIAATDDRTAADLQRKLSTSSLRLYRCTDIIGVEAGGALKNVIAIACGMAIGAGFGESARAALMTRGFAEIVRFALARGARAETLAGLSGLGDLALTATSERSRNYAFGVALGELGLSDPAVTTEGIATARAVAGIAKSEAMRLPLITVVAEFLCGGLTLAQAVESLMARPLRRE